MTIAACSTYVPCNRAELHVTHWGDRANPAVILWHGLARTGRDFDELAIALSKRYFVICPDTLGRGLSSWARDPAKDYSYAAYGSHALAILDHFQIGELRWVGTSMGGLIGVTLAAGVLKDRITHLVVNDIGPSLPDDAARRIAGYVGSPPVLPTMMELEVWLRKNYAPFGENSKAFWRRMTDTSARRTDAGSVTVHYDPQIVTQFTLHRADLDCWHHWDNVSANTLLLRGKHSDVLPLAVAQEMLRRGPKPQFIEFDRCGHAPTLASAVQQQAVTRFLDLPG
jgi:pimeloyl-ACP methyl ester carboxylesterase